MPCPICTVNALEDALTKRYYLSAIALRHLLPYLQDPGLLTRWGQGRRRLHRRAQAGHGTSDKLLRHPWGPQNQPTGTMSCSPMDPTPCVPTGGAGGPTSRGSTVGRVKATALLVIHMTRCQMWEFYSKWSLLCPKALQDELAITQPGSVEMQNNKFSLNSILHLQRFKKHAFQHRGNETAMALRCHWRFQS